MAGHWISHVKKTHCGLLAFNEGRFFGTLAVFGLAKRAWLNTVYEKCLFYPKYTSHFGDTELSAIAFATNNLAANPNAILVEVDYDKGLHPNNQDDAILYRQRAATGFDGRVTPFTPA